MVKSCWAYGTQLGNSKKPTDYLQLQTPKSKILRKLPCLQFYVPNKINDRDLNVQLVCNQAISRNHLFHYESPSTVLLFPILPNIRVPRDLLLTDQKQSTESKSLNRCT